MPGIPDSIATCVISRRPQIVSASSTSPCFRLERRVGIDSNGLR